MAGLAEEVSKDEVRPYFFDVSWNKLRVLGCQLGLEPHELDALTHRDKIDSEALLEECFKKEKISTWQEFVNVLEKPALSQHDLSTKIRLKYLSDSPSTTPNPDMEMPITGSKFMNLYMSCTFQCRECM